MEQIQNHPRCARDQEEWKKVVGGLTSLEDSFALAEGLEAIHMTSHKQEVTAPGDHSIHAHAPSCHNCDSAPERKLSHHSTSTPPHIGSSIAPGGQNRKEDSALDGNGQVYHPAPIH